MHGMKQSVSSANKRTDTEDPGQVLGQTPGQCDGKVAPPIGGAQPVCQLVFRTRTQTRVSPTAEDGDRVICP